MKLWERSGWRASLRRATRTTPAWREWHALGRLESAGVPVARGLARFSLDERDGRFSDVLVVEDLGEVLTAQESIKAALTAGRISDADHVDDQVIEITAAMFAARVLDSDHSMVNCLQTASGRVFRVDLEVARVVHSVRARRVLQAQMMARLITSYVYAVQPNMERAAAFAARVADRLHPAVSVLHRAKSLVDERLEHQRITVGVDSRPQLDW